MTTPPGGDPYGPYGQQPGGPPPGPPTSGAPVWPQPSSGGPMWPQPSSGAPYGPPPTSGGPYGPTSGGPLGGYDPNNPYGGDPTGLLGPDSTGLYPGAPTPAPARGRKGLVITLIALIAVLVVAGGGLTAFLLLRKAGGEGQPNPTAAATNFLTAIYKDKDAAKAARYVCSSARDDDLIKTKVDEVRAYAEKFNRDPQFAWDEPKVDNSTADRANLSVTVRFSTNDDRLAEQKLTILAVENDGWYVCDVATVGA